MSSDSAAPAVKRGRKTNVWLAVTTATYLVTLYFLRTNPDWNRGLRVGLTLTPVLPGVFYFRSILDSFKAMDELQRRIQLEAWAFALTGTLLVSTGLNVLNANGLGFEDYPHGLEMGGVYLTMFLLWSCGLGLANARYR